MTETAKEYCARAVVRLLDGDFAEFERLVDMAVVHHRQEKEKAHLYYQIGDVIPKAIKDRLLDKIVA